MSGEGRNEHQVSKQGRGSRRYGRHSVGRIDVEQRLASVKSKSGTEITSHNSRVCKVQVDGLFQLPPGWQPGWDDARVVVGHIALGHLMARIGQVRTEMFRKCCRIAEFYYVQPTILGCDQAPAVGATAYVQYGVIGYDKRRKN